MDNVNICSDNNYKIVFVVTLRMDLGHLQHTFADDDDNEAYWQRQRKKINSFLKTKNSWLAKNWRCEILLSALSMRSILNTLVI